MIFFAGARQLKIVHLELIFRRLYISILFLAKAKVIGVSPLSFFIFDKAPFCNNNLTIFVISLTTAKCKGVYPLLSCIFISTPLFNKKSTHSYAFEKHAQ